MKRIFLFSIIFIGSSLYGPAVLANCKCVDSASADISVPAEYMTQLACSTLAADVRRDRPCVWQSSTNVCECPSPLNVMEVKSGVTTQEACVAQPRTPAVTCVWDDATPPPDAPAEAPTPQESVLESVPLINPLTGDTSAQSIPEFVGGIIQRLLGILGSIALVVFMYGAFKWITSKGESDDIAEGTHTMAYAAIGILVIFASYGILQSVIGGVTGGG